MYVIVLYVSYITLHILTDTYTDSTVIYNIYAFQAFQEFVETFQEAPINGSKIWVKAGTYDAGARSKIAIFFFFENRY